MRGVGRRRALPRWSCIAILKRLNDARLESERQRRELLRMQDELDRAPPTRRHRPDRVDRVPPGRAPARRDRHARASAGARRRASDGPAGARARARARGAASSPASTRRTGSSTSCCASARTARSISTRSRSARSSRTASPTAAPRADERGVRLEVFRGPIGTSSSTSTRSQQALGNLLDNAIEASPQGGRVEVRPSLDGAARTHRGARLRRRRPGERPRPPLHALLHHQARAASGSASSLARELVQAPAPRSRAPADPDPSRSGHSGLERTRGRPRPAKPAAYDARPWLQPACA